MPKSKSKGKAPIGTSSESLSKDDEYDEKNIEGIGSEEKGMRMYCTHQNIIEPVDFEILRGANADKRYYDIISEPPANYMMERYNFEKKYILTPVQFDFSLDQWLTDKEKIVFDLDYKMWGVNRPTAWVSLLIRAIIKAVFDLHEKQHFHGALHYPENYGIRTNYNSEGGPDENYVEVILLYKTRDDTTVELGVGNDMMHLSYMIFDVILLGVQYKEYPEDLKDLYALFMDIDSASKTDRRWIIATHPSLWHWKTRSFYYEKLWGQYSNGDVEFRAKIEAAATKVRYATYWTDLVPKKTPLEKIFLYNRYSQDASELLRFARIVHHHITDNDKSKTRKLYIGKGDDDYMNPKYVEMKMSMVFPMLLKDIYVALCERGIFI